MRSATYKLSPATTLITATSVKTARITPRRVRKLRSLCALRASSARRMVSNWATRPRRKDTTAMRGRPPAADAAGETLAKPSMGATPKPSSTPTDKDEEGHPFVPLDADGAGFLSNFLVGQAALPIV